MMFGYKIKVIRKGCVSSARLGPGLPNPNKLIKRNLKF